MVVQLSKVQSHEGFSVLSLVNLPADADSSMYHLRHRIQLQIEYYFSAHNLARDAFLVSHMDVDHYVLVALVAGFNCVRRLTQDFGLIIEAIKCAKIMRSCGSGLPNCMFRSVGKVGAG